MAFAQDGTTEPVPQTQVVETNDDADFPWGLLGLLGLGGLAGLRRRQEPQVVETIDASRRARASSFGASLWTPPAAMLGRS